MKPIFRPLFIIVAVLGLFAAQTAMAEESYPTKMGEKLAVGVTNIVTGIGELPKTIIVKTREEGAVYGATAGFMTGIVHMLGRTLLGTADLVTFMVPTKPMIYPDYIWKDFDKETTYGIYWRMR